ncbi:hypothetical protein Q5752_005134 [Cryptotrichosporon argae]
MSPIFPPWHIDEWHAVDDRLRGGSSTSHLDAAGPRAVRFWGHLDIKTLGGAGFASRNTTFGPHPLRLSRATHAGLVVCLSPDARLSVGSSTPATLTIVLKNALSGPPKDKGPRPAQVTFEAHVVIPLSPARALTHRVPWTEFNPVYRGRDVDQSDPRYRPLDTEAIYEMSLMCRSAFGKQEGDFGVVVEDISAWEKDDNGAKADEAGAGDDAACEDVGSGCWRGIRRWLGLSRIELPENENRLCEKA